MDPAQQYHILNDERYTEHMTAAFDTVEVNPNQPITADRIYWMNKTFKLPNNTTPTDQGTLRLYEFESVLHEELSELKQARQLPQDSIERFVAISDLLADILVYTLSEAVRWGLPIEHIFHAVMDSQESKLVDGKPLMSPDGSKFIKGPNYVPPEANIERIIRKYLAQ